MADKKKNIKKKAAKKPSKYTEKLSVNATFDEVLKLTFSPKLIHK